MRDSGHNVKSADGVPRLALAAGRCGRSVATEAGPGPVLVGGSWRRRWLAAAAAPQVLRAGISRDSPDPPLFEGSGTARARLRRDVHGRIWEAGSPNMARPAGRTRSDVKPLVRDGWAPPSRTPGPTPPPAPWDPKPRESLRLRPQLGTPGPKLSRSSRRCPRLFPPPSSLRLLPSSRSRKQPGHIEPLQIRR